MYIALTRDQTCTDLTAMTAAVASSASGLISLLSEPCQNDDLKRYALINIDKVVDEHWFQISGSIAAVEALYEDDGFSHRELAALVASKVGAGSGKDQPCMEVGRQDLRLLKS